MLVWMNFRKSRGNPAQVMNKKGDSVSKNGKGYHAQWHTGSTGECKHLLTIMKSLVWCKRTCRICD